MMAAIAQLELTANLPLVLPMYALQTAQLEHHTIISVSAAPTVSALLDIAKPQPIPA